MTLDVPDGAVVIERAGNGWILRVVDVDGEGERFVTTDVFEDPEDHGASMAASLAECLWAGLSDHFRSKYQGGLVVTVEPEGRAAW